MTPGVERAATMAAARQAERIAAAAREALPGARIVQDGETVTIEGRGAIGRMGWVKGRLA